MIPERRTTRGKSRKIDLHLIRASIVPPVLGRLSYLGAVPAYATPSVLFALLRRGRGEYSSGHISGRFETLAPDPKLTF